MKSNISDIVKQLIDGMHTMSKTETIIGEPLQTKSATIIPVHRLRIAFAAGTASGNAQASARGGQSGGQGVGGTVQVDPVAVIAVGADGTPRVLAVDGESEGGLQRLVDQLPELLLKAAKSLGERALPDVKGNAKNDVSADKALGRKE
jgi:uncharacterized spore protein YtfJ